MQFDSIAISTAAAWVLTPIIVLIWSRAFPPQDSSEFFLIDYAILKRRNGWIDAVATLFMFVGAAVPLVLYKEITASDPWLIGLSFGLMVIFHFAWVCLATLPRGRKRFREFWYFYERRWGISMTGIKVIYVPLGALGLLSALMLWL